MPSKIDIWNRAMINIGADLIASEDEDSKGAEACRAMWDSTRDYVLRSYNWNCTSDRAVLGLNATSPSFAYANSFRLPSNFIKLLRVSNEKDTTVRKWRVEGKNILVDSGTCKIEYIKKVTDPNQYDSILVVALAHRLAAEIGFRMGGSRKEQERQNAFYEKTKQEGMTADSQENSKQVMGPGSWISARKNTTDDPSRLPT